MSRVSRGPRGITVKLEDHETAGLRNLVEQLGELLRQRAAESAGEGGGDSEPDDLREPADLLWAQLGIGGASAPPLDPALARLLPDAYRGDEEAASEHRYLTERGLVERKVGNAATVLASLGPARILLNEAGVQAWLRTLTDLRLVIAARLEIQFDGDPGRSESSADEALQWAYDWLGYLQSSLVSAID